MRTGGRSTTRTSLSIAAIAASLLLPLLSACSDPLLTEDEPRSQYDRNDAARDRRAPAYVWDNRGDRKPNIRGRVLSGAE